MPRAALPPSAHVPPAGSVMSSQQSKKDDAERLTDDVSVVPAKLSKKELADRIQALCVLVVDDNQYMRKMVRNLLVNCGIKDIYEAGDGITALDTIRTVGPDVVVLDWEMPLLSGAELVRIVRSPGVFPMPDIPIIMLSGHGERWRVVEAARLGVNEYLVKPVSAKSLYDRLVSITLQPRPTVQLGDYYGPEPRKLAGEAVDDANLATSLVPPLVV
jgi:two-component system, chemotaxis family, chemotaxis protein CheY